MAKTMYQATGRRKSSVARVRLLPGAGNIIINKRDIDTYFGEKDIVKNEVRRPLELTGTLGSFDVIATVNGGGFTGQAGALRHGIARALCEVDEEAYRPALKAAGFLTRDPRMKERKKPGLKKARRASQLRAASSDNMSQKKKEFITNSFFSLSLLSAAFCYRLFYDILLEYAEQHSSND